MAGSPIRAVVNLDIPGPKISRHLYGHFSEHLGRCIYGGIWVGPDSEIPNIGGIRTDIVEALKAIKTPNLRWPGGCFADEYHWRDGVGPQEERARVVNSHWGDVVEDNSFGTHEFMALCELIGAQAYINGNVGSGTVKEMSEWIEYLTRDGDSPMAALRRRNGRNEPWRVPFFGIGNEAWGCGGNMSAEQYAVLARQYATYVRDHDGNRVCRIAAGADRTDYEWTETLMKTFGCLPCNQDGPGPFQAISLHYYTTLGDFASKGDSLVFSEDDWYRTMASALKVDWLLTRHSQVMDRYDPNKKVGLVFDEWGTWWDVLDGTNPGFLHQQNTMRDALVAAVHFDSFHRHADRLIMANIAQTVNVLQAPILTDEETGAMVLTPTYHVFEMNTGHHDAESLAAHIIGDIPTFSVDEASAPSFSMSASRKDGRALLSLSNLDVAAPQDVEIDLRGAPVRGVTGRVLTSPGVTDHNTAEAPERVRPVEFADFVLDGGVIRTVLPAHSYVTLSVEFAESGA